MLNLETARDWYPVDDPVHGYDHIVRVYHIAERLAAAEGADIEIVRAAALLHDAQGIHVPETLSPDTPLPNDHITARQSRQNTNHSRRVDHQQSAAEFTKQFLYTEGWPEGRIAAVVHCIRAHRFRDNREEPVTLEAMVIFDADKLDAIGAIGVARAIAYAIKDNQPIYAQPSDKFLQSGETGPGEAHSAYHEYVYKLSKLKDLLYTRSGRELAQARHKIMSGFFESLVEEWKAES